MTLAWLSLFLVASVLTACGGSTGPPAREALPQPTSTQVPGLTPTPSPFSPPPQASPASTATSVPVLTPRATPFSTPTPSQPSPTITTVPTPTPTATPFPSPTASRPSPTITTVPAPTAAGSPSASREAGDGQPGIPPSSLAAGERRLAVIENGDWRFIKNGGRVNLANGLSVELFLDPYPPTQLTAVLDVYLTRRGQPVTGASADIAYDMKGMFHGPFMSVAKNLGQGHYLLTIEYIMYSAWEHKLTIYLPEDRYELAVGVVVSPSLLP